MRFRLLLAAALIGGAFSSAEAQVQLATDSPKPLTPAQSLKRFQLEPGFRIELVAAEPLVADPVAMAFDARGRIFVCEIHGYNLEGYLDALDQNKTGVLDKAVRRIPANPEAQRRAAGEQYGTVKLLEDLDGDGRMDRATVWADRLPPCYGVVAARQGVIALCAPDIVYLADRDGDGKAEMRETLFTGFGANDMWSRINNPRPGVDNWIYAVNGIGSGGTIRGPHLGKPVVLGATCFRFRADGTALEPVAGNTSGFGLTIDDWGNRFLVTNQQHALLVAPLEHRYLVRNPYYAAPSAVVNISSYGHPAAVYPISQPDPWRLARSKDPAWVKFYGVAEATANGFFTAASGQAIYQAPQFPREYWGNHFSVDNAQNMIHRCVLEADGAGYKARRPRPDEHREFLTTQEQWFRPVNLMTGPDGALYVVDMYRAIIEDYSAIPRYLQQLYVQAIIDGADRGRIYRITAGACPVSKVHLAQASSAQLLGELSSLNGWRRLAAQRLLVERQDRSVVESLTRLLADGATPQARLHALYTLDGLGALPPQLTERALSDKHFAVRTHALALAEPWLDRQPALLHKVLALAEDPHPRVRLQVAFTLGQTKAPQAVARLATLAAREGDAPWLQAAILSSSTESAAALLQSLMKPAAAPPGQPLIRPLASVIGARRREAEVAQAMSAAASRAATDLRTTACLEGLIEGLQRGRQERRDWAAAQKPLEQLLAVDHVAVQPLALRLSGVLGLSGSPSVKNALSAAGRAARDANRPLAERISAVGLLAGTPYAIAGPVLGDLLDARQPLDLQLAAVRALATVDAAEADALLLADWPSRTPKLQEGILEALFSRQARLQKLLAAVEQKQIPASALDAFRRSQLLENPNAEIRQHAARLLRGANTQRAMVIETYVAALRGPRDPQRGRQVYDKQCAKCHAIQNLGYVVGPDLSVITRKSDEMLVSDVLDPSNQITAGFNNYTVITDDGRIFTGVLAAETATSVTLRREEAKDTVLLRQNVETIAASAGSMMPENLEKEVTPKDLVDLVAYLRSAVGAPGTTLVTLFDDELTFPALLTEGRGKARVCSGDRFSGSAALAIDPPQRFSANIPGWQYRIVEKPGPGEFRYLRFAWKSAGAEGLMLELADQGRWAPADMPLRRYYAGANTIGWAGIALVVTAPHDWTVVTRDLWHDFGEFTLTGIAPTAMGGEALFDKIELLREPAK